MDLSIGDCNIGSLDLLLRDGFVGDLELLLDDGSLLSGGSTPIGEDGGSGLGLR